MKTTKSYTSVEQSRKLAEILPLESADMEYILEQWIDEETDCHKEEYCEIPVVKVNDDCPLQPITLPCWSLAALLDVLESEINSEYGETYLLNITKDGIWWYIDYIKQYDGSSDIETTPTEELIDACYEMIIKLNEQKLL